eukprot:TRINITY_DN2143_c0_g1_i2.p1 TRINITY_DN2143_c0_g1~~TRINITY_DN2143_c0_g1_i2.p1  ORF type:complete len:144 (+),score=33.24 TRINITY_DN2143_c0_g1_i2:32-463(+)
MKYLVAVDGTNESHFAFEKCFQMFRKGDSISLLHVTNLDQFIESEDLNYTAFNDGNTKMMMQAESLLQSYETKLKEAQIESKRILLTAGSPAEKICEIAGEDQVDFIILGTHYRNPLQKLLRGSIFGVCDTQYEMWCDCGATR